MKAWLGVDTALLHGSICAVGLVLVMLVAPTGVSGQQVSYDSTFKSSGQTFRARLTRLKNGKTLFSITRNSSTILRDTVHTDHLNLLDFNDDGNPDILVSFEGNSSIESLLLFDRKTRTFRQVEDFENYPSANKVQGSNGFYYSYHRAGCADSYWVSDLFTIVDFRVLHKAQIFGEGCNEPMQIKIFRVDRGRKDLQETLPYTMATEDKWGFIKEYWVRNAGKYN